MTCIFCLERPATEAEHVLPKSWYPSTTQTTVQYLTVPVCGICADDFERAERAFKLPVLMGLDPRHPDVAGVMEAFRRSWQFDKAPTLKESVYRAGRLRKISRQVKFVMRSPDTPSPWRLEVPVRTPAGLHVMASPALHLEQKVSARICEKFVRGLHFGDFDTPVPAGAPIEFFWARDIGPEARAEFYKIPVNNRLAPGLRYRVLKDGDLSVWLFLLWGQMEFGARVGKPPQSSGKP
jgi:hypothetical protein